MVAGVLGPCVCGGCGGVGGREVRGWKVVVVTCGGGEGAARAIC